MANPAPATTEVCPGDLSEHPAALAWAKLNPQVAEIGPIHTLKRNKKSAIYRLGDIGPGGSSIIAKRFRTETGLTERIIYQEVLPCLPFPVLRCFGFVEDEDDQFCWLFLEDAGPEQYLPELERHRAEASRWMALLHTSAAHLPAAARLPDRGARFYLEQLQLARGNLITAFDNPALRPSELDVLKAIVRQCNLLESRWDQVEQAGKGIPCTFVHGDLKAKNLRVRPTQEGIILLPFDWEIAGWGLPVTDLLRCPDLALYGSEARKHWPNLTFSELERLTQVGLTFRALISIYWKSLALSYEWVEWPVDKLRLYCAKLQECIGLLEIA